MISRPLAEGLALALTGLLLALVALLAPIAQPQDYHQFADTRSLTAGRLVVPNAADVLTSLAFLAVGVAGLVCHGRAAPLQRLPLGLMFAGLVLTGLGSGWYHLAPTDATLVWDRLPMALTFAGALGTLATERLGPTPGGRWLLGWLLLGTLGVAHWAVAGDLRLYLVAQFGGLGALLLWFRLPPVAGMGRLPWGWLVLAYGVAKGCELLDRQIWLLTSGVLAGHAAKHLVAALGVVPILWALGRPGIGCRAELPG
jgi:hypothetical protein